MLHDIIETLIVLIITTSIFLIVGNIKRGVKPMFVYDKKKLKFGFRNKNQMPLFMIWREYWKDEEIVFGTVLFEIG